jgi:hypothetical protein
MSVRRVGLLLSMSILALPLRALAQEAETEAPPEAPSDDGDTATDPADASADAITPEERERAELHLASARSHVRAGHPDRAIGDFTTAYEILGDPAILLEVARAQEEMLELPRALSAYEAYLATDADDAEARARAERRASFLRQRITQIRGSAPPPRRPPPRGDDDDDDDDDEDADAYDPVPRLVGNIVMFGLSGAALITAAVFGGLVLAEDTELTEGCGATLSCQREDLEDLNTYRVTTDVAFFASLVTALGGLLFLLTTPDPPAEEPAEAATEARIQVAPWIEPRSGGGVVAAGRF